MKKSPIKNMAYWKAKNQATPLKGVEGDSRSTRPSMMSAGIGMMGFGKQIRKATAADRLDPEAGKGGINYSPPPEPTNTTPSLTAGIIPTQDANTDPALDEKIEEKVNEVVNQKTGAGLV